MKRRLATAVITGGIGAGVGVGVAIWQGLNAHMLGIVLATGLVGFFFGLILKFRVL